MKTKRIAGQIYKRFMLSLLGKNGMKLKGNIGGRSEDFEKNV